MQTTWYLASISLTAGLIPSACRPILRLLVETGIGSENESAVKKVKVRMRRQASCMVTIVRARLDSLVSET